MVISCSECFLVDADKHLVSRVASGLPSGNPVEIGLNSLLLESRTSRDLGPAFMPIYASNAWNAFSFLR